MEKLKNITIIFVLAVGLLSPVAPAKTTSVLLQEGLYAEEIEGDLDTAIKMYEQVISESKKVKRDAAQATYRIGMCYLKKGEKVKAANQFSNLVSRFPEQKSIVDKARNQLAKLRPPIKVFEPQALDEQLKSGEVPSFEVQVYDNTALDLDSGEIAMLKDEWPDRFDVAWDNDEGGVLMKKAGSGVRFLGLPSGEKQMWDEAIYMARGNIDELRNSNTRGIWASRGKFAAVLTSEGNLAVIQIGEYDANKGTIYGWVEKISVEYLSFGPVIERVINDNGEEKNWLIDFETGRLFSPSTETRSDEAFSRWITENRIDAMGETRTSSPGLYGFEMEAIPIAAETWETISPKGLADALSIAKSGIRTVMSAKGKLPLTYTFKTREGGMGVVQILQMQYKKKPRYFRIRYKMLQQKYHEIEALIRKMHQPEARRFTALNKLIEIGEPAVEPLISELEKSNNWQVPKALGAIGDKRAVEPLIQKWQKCDWSPMKEVISEALERITDKKLGQDKQKWGKWWQETRSFISPEATIQNFMAAAMKLDMNNAMEYVADDSHDYKDIQEIFEESEHPFNVLFRKTDPAVPVKIIETKIIDNMCEAVWQITFKEDLTIKGKTIHAGETFDIDGDLRRYGDKWLIVGI